MATTTQITYEVYQPHMTGPEALQTGTAISRHRTPDAARQKIRKEIAALRRVPGQGQSWLDWHIRAVENGYRRHISGAELEG